MITFKKRTSEVWSRPQVWSTPLNFLKFFKTNFFYRYSAVHVIQGYSSCKLNQSLGNCYYTVPLFKLSWSPPKKLRIRRFWRSYLDQNLPRITDLISDLTGDQ